MLRLYFFCKFFVKVHQNKKKKVFLLVLHYQISQFFIIGATELCDRLIILDENKSRHRGNIILHCNILALININFKNKHIIKFLCQFFQFRRDHLAGTTPSRKKINHDQLITSVVQFRHQVGLQQFKRSLDII